MVRPTLWDTAIDPCTVSGDRSAATVPGKTATMPLQLIEHVAAGIPALLPSQSPHLPEECISLDITTAALPWSGEANIRPVPGPSVRAKVNRIAAIRRPMSSMDR